MAADSAKPRILVRAYWYVIAGVVTLCLNPALFALFHQVFDWSHYVAYGLSLAIVNLLQFFWNYFVGFRSREPMSKSATRQTITFVVANALNYALVVALQAALPQWKLQIIVVVQVFVAGIKFVAYHLWVYPEPHERQ